MEKSRKCRVGAPTDELFRRLHDAEQRCARRKQAKPDAIALRAHRAERLLWLADQLRAGQWRPAPGLVFVTTRPKHREVHAARYSDRVVHHLIAQDLAPAIDRRLCDKTFACRAGKGTHAAVAAVQQQMWAMSRHGKVRVYVLQMDVVNFFHSIDRERLWTILQAPLRDVAKAKPPPYDLSAAVRALLDDEPALRATRVGDPRGFDRVPLHKRLAAQQPGRGLPIGNLTSQWFANAYLSVLDGFVQRQLGFSGYARYMDDFVVLHTDAAKLVAAGHAIVAMLRDRLGLEVHVDKPVCPASTGIDFCGAIIRPAYSLPRRRVVSAWQERLDAAAEQLHVKIVPAGRSIVLAGFGRVSGPCAVWPIDGGALDTLRAAWGSGLGCTGHMAARRLHGRMWLRHPLLGRFLLRRKSPMGLRLGDPAAERGARVWPDWSAQRYHLLAMAGSAVVVARVGRNLELLRRRDAHRCGVSQPSPHRPFARTPVENGERWLAAALAGRHDVALAVQLPDYHGKVRGRTIRWLIQPLDRFLRWKEQFAVQAGQTPMYRRTPRRLGVRPKRSTDTSVATTNEAASAPSAESVPRCTAAGQYLLALFDE